MSAMSAIEQPGGEVRQDDGLLGLRQQVGGLGHEVHAAEHDRLGLGVRLRGVRELERVADVVGVAHHLFALVEVAEDHDPVAEGRLRRADARVELFGGGLAVLGGQLALAGRTGRDDVAHRRARAVAGARVEVPRPGGEVGVAGLGGRGARDDRLDRVVDGRVGRPGLEGEDRCGHGVLDSLGSQWRTTSGPRSASSTSWL